MSDSRVTGRGAVLHASPRGASLVLRAQVTERSLEVFAEHGYEATSVAMLCDASGISVGSLYHHFTNKAGVATVVYAEALRRYQASLHEVLASDPDAEAGVFALVAAHHEWVAEESAWARFMLAMGDLPEIHAAEGEWTAANERLFDALNSWSSPLMQAGDLELLEPGVFVAVLFGPSYMHSRTTLSREFETGTREQRNHGEALVFGAAAWRALRCGGTHLAGFPGTDTR